MSWLAISIGLPIWLGLVALVLLFFRSAQRLRNDAEQELAADLAERQRLGRPVLVERSDAASKLARE